MTAPEQLIAAGAPLWITILVIVLPMFMTFSKSMGKVPGVLGALSRRWQTRQLRDVERSEDLDMAIKEAVKRRVEEEMKPIQERMRRLEERLAASDEEIALRDEYILVQARYIRGVVEVAIERGFEGLEEPPARFTQWIRARGRIDGHDPQRE